MQTRRALLIFQKRVFHLLLLTTLSVSGCVSQAAKSSSETNSKLEGGDIVTNNVDTTPQIQSAAFFDVNTAWLITYYKNDLLRTEDGGATWNKLSPASYSGHADTHFSQVSFINSQHGWALDETGQVWRTSDGGRTWNEIGKLESHDSKKWIGFNGAVQISFTDELHGWIIETSTIWRTEDGGSNWTRVFYTLDPNIKGQPVRGYFLDAQKAWVCGTDGEIYSTADGGRNWSVKTIESHAFTDINFVNEKTGWLTRAPDGQLYRTDDGGKTWRPLARFNPDTYLKSTWFLNEKEGWAVGQHVWKKINEQQPEKSYYTSQGVLLHTLDGGQSWEEAPVGEHDEFFDRVYFVDGQHGWLFGRDNVYRTEDGGITWLTVLKIPPVKATIEPRD